METPLRFSWKLSICLVSAALTASPVSTMVLDLDHGSVQAEEAEIHSFSTLSLKEASVAAATVRCEKLPTMEQVASKEARHMVPPEASPRAKPAMEKIAGMPAGFVSMFAVNTLIFTIQKPDLSLAPKHLNPRVSPVPPSRFTQHGVVDGRASRLGGTFCLRQEDQGVQGF